jgi:hypothetical protein
MELNYFLKDYIDNNYRTQIADDIAKQLGKEINTMFSDTNISREDRGIIYLTHMHYLVDKIDTLRNKNALLKGLGINITKKDKLFAKYPYVQPRNVAPPMPARPTLKQLEEYDYSAAPILHPVARETIEEYEERIAREEAANNAIAAARYGGRRRTNRRKAKRGTRRRA